MKTEINLENQNKFSNLYWGQKIGRSFNPELFVKYVMNDDYFNSVIEYLELKPLSSLSDEDAKILVELEGYVSMQAAKDYVIEHSPYLFGITYDILRSKGYALPWMGLLVEDMVEAGWIKLTKS